MRYLLLALAATLAVTSSQAMANSGIGINGLIVYGGQSGTVAIHLDQGQDYTFDYSGYGFVELVNPQGQTTIHVDMTGDLNEGSIPFRAAYTADYIVRASLPASDPHAQYGTSSVEISQDCRGDAKTRCVMQPDGAEGRGGISDPRDQDWYRLPVRKGRTYLIEAGADPGRVVVTIRTPSGKVVKEFTSNGFRHPASTLFRTTVAGDYRVAVMLAGTNGAEYVVRVNVK